MLCCWRSPCRANILAALTHTHTHTQFARSTRIWLCIIHVRIVGDERKLAAQCASKWCTQWNLFIFFEIHGRLRSRCKRVGWRLPHARLSFVVAGTGRSNVCMCSAAAFEWARNLLTFYVGKRVYVYGTNDWRVKCGRRLQCTQFTVFTLFIFDGSLR